MSLHSSIVDYVATKTTVTDIIGTGSAMKFFPQLAKGGQALPYAIYSREGVRRNPASAGSTGLVTTTLRIVSYAEEYDDAFTLANAFRLILDGKRGTVGDQYFSACNLVTESEFVDPALFGMNDLPHFVAQEFEITHRESAPTL